MLVVGAVSTNLKASEATKCDPYKRPFYISDMLIAMPEGKAKNWLQKVKSKHGNVKFADSHDGEIPTYLGLGIYDPILGIDRHGPHTNGEFTIYCSSQRGSEGVIFIDGEPAVSR